MSFDAGSSDMACFFPVHSRCVLLSSNQNQSGEANRAHAEINAGV